MQTKFFVGTRITPDLKSHLHIIEEGLFQQILHEGKEYLGIYLNASCPNLQEIRSFSNQFITSLQTQCPELRADKLSIVIFAQLFVG